MTDCQQQAGLAAWVPFHESASAVTQLYRGTVFNFCWFFNEQEIVTITDQARLKSTCPKKICECVCIYVYCRVHCHCPWMRSYSPRKLN